MILVAQGFDSLSLFQVPELTFPMALDKRSVIENQFSIDGTH
jgi:hypothetical protein